MRAQCLPFAQIPQTTRLFTDFLSYFPSVRPFYPHSPHFSEWVKAQASTLQYDPARREKVSAILERQNLSLGASPQTLSSINRLRKGAAAVVTGQQVGLFGGPMFAIYKALTAIKLAEDSAAAGIDAVPVFWLATYDHDLAEVNHVSLPGSDGILRTLTTSSHSVAGAPVSAVHLGEEILPVVEEAAALLGNSEVSQFLRESYRAGESLGSAFARFFTRLFGQWGVILLDASDPELHRVASPIYRKAIERTEDLDAALLTRGQELEKAGYYQQVKVTPSSVLLFTLHNGARTAIHRRINGSDNTAEFIIGSESGAEKLSSSELLDRIAETPENFSPNVLLRPVVQDYILPTLAYTGGAAEAAYFAQVGAVYEMLLGRVTPIVPRFSATLVEPKVQRWLGQYGITVLDTLQGPEALRQNLASRTLPADLQAAFERANKSVEESFSGLKDALAKLDPTLVEASQTGASKIHYQLDRLRERALAAELRRSEVVSRHAAVLSEMLYPNGELQERGIAGAYFVARHGVELLRSIHQTMPTDCHDHQILEL
ncbi:MAG TPA: bacillithiol biosynthesis cysteine-adding enzyme BshC [Candidatus Eremiobacteraceae bacterium]|nr:bacillithiol biosynthesis cysteine-adding enzyme BshC [Candidatus Eremiobacteraceae bacterium]